MSRIAVVVDSTADLDDQQRERAGIKVVPLNVHFGDEVLRDGVDISSARFLERLATARDLPTTSQPSPAVFEDRFRTLAPDHDGIVVLALSSKLSGTYNSAMLAAKAVSDLIPVEIVDSLSASAGLAMQALRAAELVASLRELQPVTTQLRTEVAKYELIFFADTLEYLQRGGRIGRAQSLVGSMLRIKPLLRLDEGSVVPYERTRTRAKAIDGLVDFVMGLPAVGRLGILHGGQLDDAHQLRDRLASRVTPDDIIYSQYGPVLAAHVGPRALGVCVFEGAK